MALLPTLTSFQLETVMLGLGFLFSCRDIMKPSKKLRIFVIYLMVLAILQIIVNRVTSFGQVGNKKRFYANTLWVLNACTLSSDEASEIKAFSEFHSRIQSREFEILLAISAVILAAWIFLHRTAEGNVLFEQIHTAVVQRFPNVDILRLENNFLAFGNSGGRSLLALSCALAAFLSTIIWVMLAVALILGILLVGPQVYPEMDNKVDSLARRWESRFSQWISRWRVLERFSNLNQRFL